MKIADHPATADTTADDQKVKKSENKTKMEQIGIKVEEKLEEPVPSPSSQDVDLKNVDLDDLYSKYKVRIIFIYLLSSIKLLNFLVILGTN